MSVWKKLVMAIVIGSSMGVFSTYSTVAIAAEDRAGSRKATDDTIKAIEEGIAATENGSSAKEIRSYYFKARQFSKDINGETVARDLQDGSDALLAVSRSLKTDAQGNFDSTQVVAAWNEALAIFKTIQQKQH